MAVAGLTRKRLAFAERVRTPGVRFKGKNGIEAYSPVSYACVLLLNKPEMMQRRAKSIKEYVVLDMRIMNEKAKQHVATLLKFAFAAAIVYYMIATGKLDLHQISQIAHKQLMIIKVLLTILAVYALVTIRWYCLLIWQGIPTTFRTTARINLIGFFFNSFLPGAFGGDVVKAFYVAKENNEHRTRAVITILIDRIMGFETLMIVAFVALIINYRTLSTNPQLKALSTAIALYILCSFVAAAAVFSRRVKHFFVSIGLNKLVYKLPRHDILINIYDAFHVYSDQKMRLVKAMAITIPLDLINIYAFFIIGREMGESLVPLASYYTAVPVGMLMLSLPVAPAGIGVGQGAFYKLFVWFGAASGAFGATIITIYQLLTITINMCFVFVYLSNRKEVRKAIVSAKGERP
jgi:uncharacterized protein (TIRG00374 family)